MDAPNMFFLPSIGTGERIVDRQHDVTWVDSQWSGGGSVTGHTSELSPFYISLKDYRDLLPSKKSLAQRYTLNQDRSLCCLHNAQVAEHADCQELADIWSLIAVTLQNEVIPLPSLQPEGIAKLTATSGQYRRLRSKDSGIDLSFDETLGNGSLRGSELGPISSQQPLVVEDL